MHKFNEEILADIDVTINQIVENAKVLKFAKIHHYFVQEVDALEKTQESLLARLMHRQSQLEIEKKHTLESIRKKSIEHKVVEYARSIKRSRKKITSQTRGCYLTPRKRRFFHDEASS